MKLNFFLPKQPIFFDLFIKLSNQALDIAELLNELSTTADSFELKVFSQQAKEIEHRADDITHEIVDRLNRTFVTPFDREDIYNLTEEIDDIVDRIENVIHNIQIYQISPKEKFVGDFARIIKKDAEYLNKLTEQLKLQRYSDSFKGLILEIHTLEDQGDELFLRTLEYLFENDQDPVAIIKLKDIAEDLEKVVDKFQDASNTFENILVKSQ